MAGDPEPTPEALAWDRIGRFFANMATVAQQVSRRNLTLWSSVSNNLRSEKYGADAMARDVARALAAVSDNVEDIWTGLARIPETERIATAVPTAFLYFAAVPKETSLTASQETSKLLYALPAPIFIRVAPADLQTIREAKIGFYGVREGADGPEQAVDQLTAAVKITRTTGGFRLEGSGARELTPGVYSGAVYTADPPHRELASLHVVVERPSTYKAERESATAD